MKVCVLQGLFTQVLVFITSPIPPSVWKAVFQFNYMRACVHTCRYNISAGTSEKIQLGALIGAFQSVRDIVGGTIS